MRSNSFYSKNSLTGSLLIVASIGFFIGWLLMPDPGTTHAAHILSIVKQSRASVMASIIVQIITSILYLVALFQLAGVNFRQKKSTMAGVILLGIGVLGLCSDAFFHLLAYFMTNDSVTIQQDVVRVMDLMQTTGVAFLLPILLPFFVGSLVLAIALNKKAMITKTAWFVITAAFSLGILSVIAEKTHICQPSPMIVTLGLFAIGQAFIGVDLIKHTRSQQPKTTGLAYQLN